MAESLGPEWETDKGNLVLYVQPFQMGLQLTYKGQMGIITALRFTLIGSMVSHWPLPLLIDRLAKWNAGRCIRAMQRYSPGQFYRLPSSQGVLG